MVCYPLQPNDRRYLRYLPVPRDPNLCPWIGFLQASWRPLGRLLCHGKREVFFRIPWHCFRVNVLHFFFKQHFFLNFESYISSYVHCLWFFLFWTSLVYYIPHLLLQKKTASFHGTKWSNYLVEHQALGGSRSIWEWKPTRRRISIGTKGFFFSPTHLPMSNHT